MVEGINRKAADQELIAYLEKGVKEEPVDLDEAFGKMDIKDYSFHDSEILEVRETNNQTLEFLIDFPTDRENNIFKHHVLSFHDVVNYNVKEIPFEGPVTILEINELGNVTHTWGQGKNAIEATRCRIEMITNAGSRKIEYTTCHLKKSDL